MPSTFSDQIQELVRRDMAKENVDERLKQLIASIPNEQIAFNVISSERLGGMLPTIKSFPILAHYYGEKKKQNLVIFFPEQFANDMSMVIQHSEMKQYRDTLTVIGVNADEFAQLKQKCAVPRAGLVKGAQAAKCAKKGAAKSDTGCDWSISNPNNLREEFNIVNNYATAPFHSLSFEDICNAFEQIRSQQCQNECAANSAARFLIMCHVGWESGGWRMNYPQFYQRCPRDSDSWDERLGFLGVIGQLVASGSGGTGPSLFQLRDYINTHLARWPTSPFKHCEVETFSFFQNCAQAIGNSIEARNPVIVFIFWEPTCWHFCNIVGIKKAQNGNVEGFLLLETGKHIDYRQYANLANIMRNEYKPITDLSSGGKPGDFNIIRAIRR